MASMKRDKIVNMLETTLRKNMGMWYVLLRKAKKNPEQFFMELSCKVLQDSEYDVYFRLKTKTLETAEQFVYTQPVSRFAIVMQGPIRTESNYTANVAAYYRELYPTSIVVVSTWEDEPQEAIESVRKTGAEIVLSAKPVYGGHLNLNYQIVNSYAGIRYAAKRGAQYIAKTRTDQCLRKAHAFEYMLSLLETFPTATPYKQKTRLIAMSINYGNMFYPYFMSDFFYFGAAEEMLKLFGIPLDGRQKFSMPANSTRREYSDSMYAPEVYLMKHYLMAIGCKGDGTVQDYWEAVKKSLICIDMKSVDLDWPKYNGKYSLHSFYGDFFWDDMPEKKKTVNFDFVNWLNLYTGVLKYCPELEKYADIVFR